MILQLLEKRAAGLRKKAVEEVDKEPLYKRPISGTLGRLSAPGTAIILGTTAPFRHTASSSDEHAKALLQALVKDKMVDKDQPLRINYGGVHPIDSIKRVWKNPRTSTGGKVLGTLGTPLSQLSATLSRGDHYNPYSHEVTMYNDDPAIMAHELGHAKDFAHSKYPTLYSLMRIIPFAPLYQEGVASQHAIKLLRKAELQDEVQRANRVLGGGFGSYVGHAVAPGVGEVPGALAGQAIGYFGQPFNNEKFGAAGLYAQLEKRARAILSTKKVSQ